MKPSETARAALPSIFPSAVSASRPLSVGCTTGCVCCAAQTTISRMASSSRNCCFSASFKYSAIAVSCSPRPLHDAVQHSPDETAVSATGERHGDGRGHGAPEDGLHQGQEKHV